MTTLRSGFTVVENCCSAKECADIALRLSDLSTPGTRRLLDLDWCQELGRTLQDRLAESLPEIRNLLAIQCTYFNKSPETNWFVTYHQDRSIPVASSVCAEAWPSVSKKEGLTFIHASDEVLNQMLAVRLHLDDSTIDNGPLRVISESHLNGTLASNQISSLRATGHECSIIVHAGGVLLMRPLLLHASSKSKSKVSRRVLHFLFGPPTLPDGLEW
jgi:hypothetical protein